MQAQRYGSLPVAHATGGLNDTIDDGNTGFLFTELSARGLMSACDRALDAFGDESRLSAMRRAAMAQAFSWAGAASGYEALYARLAGRPPMAERRASTATTSSSGVQGVGELEEAA
jgi:starch synthase